MYEMKFIQLIICLKLIVGIFYSYHVYKLIRIDQIRIRIIWTVYLKLVLYPKENLAAASAVTTKFYAKRTITILVLWKFEPRLCWPSSSVVSQEIAFDNAFELDCFNICICLTVLVLICIGIYIQKRFIVFDIVSFYLY